MAGAGGRRWRDLLAGRARKRKSAFGSGAELREAALRLLDQHQNLTDLLLEVEESAKPDGQGGAELQEVSSASFIVSVLQEQASRLGVPTAALAAKNAVTNIERICRVPASPSQLPLLDLDQRKRLSRLLQTLKDLLANNVFSRSLFCQELWKMKDPPVLEVVWHLHRGDILGLAELLESSPSAAGEWLCHSLRRLCQPHPEACGDLELPGHLLSDLAVVFVQNGFQQTSDLGRKLEFKKVPHICHAVLHRMLTCDLHSKLLCLLYSGGGICFPSGSLPAPHVPHTHVLHNLTAELLFLCLSPQRQHFKHFTPSLAACFSIVLSAAAEPVLLLLTCRPCLKSHSARIIEGVLDAVGKEKQEDVSTLQAMRFWLNVFNVSGYRSAVHPDSLQQFFRHTLTEVLTYNPSWKVSDAIRMQKEWSFTRTCSLLTTLYRKLFMAFSAKECVCQLQQVLETREVNWQHVLSCVSTLAVCRAEAEQLFRDLLSHLLMKAFENYDMENLITAFLIARQAALEGPAVFMPYSEWFKASFGNAGGHHGSSKKALVFLFEFLSELVPFEAAPYLKVHIMYPPFVPTKHRPILLEYITLAKTRLADLKVAIEDMGLYEDLSTTDESVQPQAQALRDVEKALQIFENTRKIPTSVIEASIFRRPYYTSWFLPALLRPRVLPRAPDVRMAFIDSLKRADKIPSNLYSTYVQACRAAKEKRLQDECKEESSPSREPVEQLRAELAVLRTLVVDQAKYEDVPAQVAVISHTLGSVCAQDSHEDQTAAATSPIQVNISAPRLEPCQQSVVDLLLTSFCQHLVAASYFNPPNRQGPCLSLFVKMMCGHRNLLPALLGRLCQLIYHQGPSLNDAHILGLAAFVIHLGESRALIPAVEANFGLSQPVPQKVLSVSEFWNLLLTCRTAESFAFCLRFCTAAASYLMCKFSSYSHEDLCALLPPSLVKKLQYLVPRLCLEARGALWEEGPAELLWSSLSCPSRDYRRASLSLWQQARFQQLLKEQAFQLSFREWLLLELEVSPEKDILSASERQDFHYWAIYQRYLPAPSASGGCDGDLQQACGILINTLLDSSQRLELGSRGRWEVSVSPGILCKLQEMVLELGCRQKLLSGSSDAQRHFLFEILQERLRNGEQGSALGQQLWRQQELLLHRRILVGLPASTLIMTCQKGRKTMLDCEDFFNFVNSELKNVCSRGYALSYDITAHFFRGLLHASLGCEEPAEGVSEVLTACQSRCPTLLFSAVLWWPSLEPVLCSQWKRLFGDPLAEELRRLREWQSSAASFLSSGAVFPLSGPPWISAAFLHCAVQQQSRRGQGSRALKRLGTGTEQLLVSLLFFSLLDLISAKIAPKEGVDFQASLEWSLEILQCLEERGTSWPLLFHSAGKEPGHYVVLRSAASARHTRLLPLAFYSLTPCFHHELLAREPTFLHLALDLYVQLLQLFVEGQELPQPDPAGQSPGPAEHEDPLQLISSARRFLLAAIPRCPAQSFANIRPLLATCEELDPELGATLLHFSRPAMAMELDEELVLFD